MKTPPLTKEQRIKLDKIKDEVAKSDGFVNWADAEFHLTPGSVMLLLEFVAIRYSEQETQPALARNKELETLINSPELDDFIQGVKLESAHQTEKWGRELEETSHPGHYTLVVGKLLGKLITSMWDLDKDKFKHHCITIAAVMFNAHRQTIKKDTHTYRYFNQAVEGPTLKVK